MDFKDCSMSQQRPKSSTPMSNRIDLKKIEDTHDIESQTLYKALVEKKTFVLQTARLTAGISDLNSGGTGTNCSDSFHSGKNSAVKTQKKQAPPRRA